MVVWFVELAENYSEAKQPTQLFSSENNFLTPARAFISVTLIFSYSILIGEIEFLMFSI